MSTKHFIRHLALFCLADEPQSLRRLLASDTSIHERRGVERGGAGQDVEGGGVEAKADGDGCQQQDCSDLRHFSFPLSAQPRSPRVLMSGLGFGG